MQFSDVFSILLIILYSYTIISIIRGHNYQFIFYLVIVSTVIQILDKPFFIQLEFIDIVGNTFILFNYNKYKYFFKKTNVLKFAIFLSLPILIGFINTIIPFEYTTANFLSRAVVFLKASLRVTGIFGTILFISYNLFHKKQALQKIIQILSYSILISSFFSLIVYFDLSSPYYFFKGYSYTPNPSDYFYQYRLNGFCYEPRMLGYFTALNYFLFDFIIDSSFKKIVLKMFSLIILILTFSTGGFLFFLFLFLTSSLIFKSLYNFSKQILAFGFFLSIIILIFSNQIDSIVTLIQLNFEKRLLDEKYFEFKYFPSFFTNLELHDLPVIFYFDNNILNLFFGFGYGLTRLFMGPFSWVADISGDRFSLNGTVTCCEPHVGLVYFLSVGGLLFLFLWLYFYIKSTYFLFKNWKVISPKNRLFYSVISMAIFFLLFQIPQSSIIVIYYYIYFIHINSENLNYDSKLLY